MDNIKVTSAVKGDKTLKKLALFSICAYVLFSTVFDAMKTELSRLSSFAIYFCLICCGLYVLSKGTFKFGSVEGWLVVFGIALAVSLLYTPTVDSIVNMYFYRYCSSAILVMLISNVVADKKDVDLIIDAYILSGVVLALYMYSTYGIANLAAATQRIDNLFGNQNATGLSCAFSVSFAVYRLAVLKRRRWLLYTLSIVICIPAMMFSGSRKALLIAAVAILAFLFTYTRIEIPVKKLLMLAGVILVIFAVIYFVPAFSVIKDRILSTFEVLGGNTKAETGASDINRMTYFKLGLQEFLKSPIYGNGFMYSYHYFGTYSHCNYVELLMNGGIITFIVFYYIYAVIYRKAKKELKDSENRDYAALRIMLIWAFLAMDIGVVSYYDRYTLILLALCTCKVGEAAEKIKNKE